MGARAKVRRKPKGRSENKTGDKAAENSCRLDSLLCIENLQTGGLAPAGVTMGGAERTRIQFCQAPVYRHIAAPVTHAHKNQGKVDEGSLDKA